MSTHKNVEIALPVFNEEEALERNVMLLVNYLTANATYDWKITIADNASTDRTMEIGQKLAAGNERIIYKRIPVKGRGYALRQVFSQSTADIVAYMDIDLSTNLTYLEPLMSGVINCYDAAIGSRLMRESRTTRRLFRELISRCYNILLKLLFFNSFSDAQCGFKAFRTDVIKQILPFVRNNNWFFDTEVLLLLEYNKARIFQVPVEWVDDLTSKVHIGKTIWEDIMGMIYMRLTPRKKLLRK